MVYFPAAPLVYFYPALDNIAMRLAAKSQRNALVTLIFILRLFRTLREASAVLSRLTEADLLATYEIQGYTTTGLSAVYQVVEHFGLHHGQVIYITKMLRGEDLGFYRELNETGRAGQISEKVSIV